MVVNIHNNVEEFHWVKGLDSRIVAEMINSVQANILIDLNGFPRICCPGKSCIINADGSAGYTDGGHTEVVAAKPAPVTVNYLGYPYTMALPQFDYVLTDRSAVVQD